jgi:1-pyrroline-5-carboxylate dehydrogenase
MLNRLSRGLVSRVSYGACSWRSFSSHGRLTLPSFRNEKLLDYAPGSAERAGLKQALVAMKSEVVEIPCIVGGKEVWTGDVGEQVMPSNHQHVLAKFHQVDDNTLQMAIDACAAASEEWSAMPINQRAALFTRAADLMATTYRYELMASVMHGTGKNVWQAEIDSACEIVDFFRINPKFAEEIYAMQPPLNSDFVWNQSEYRPLEGFVLAIAPFNFLAIFGNLFGAPALMGNTTIVKPASTAVLSGYVVMKILKEAGFPDGVVNFLPGAGRTVGKALDHADFAGLHFTGSTETFNNLWGQIGNNLGKYKSYPRVVGETGGKNFHFIHPSADVENAVNSTIRGAFEYQGQKCSATSRMYVPESLWNAGGFKEKLVERVESIKMGQPEDFSVFMTAVIDQNSFDTITGALKRADADPDCTFVAGGQYDDSEGFFIRPTVIETKNPKSETMETELFGPVLTVYVYEDAKIDETLELVDTTSQYALTGAIFANDRNAIQHLSYKLRNSSGNFYINDKSTGAVVGQQPFGGARASGTNDKAGSTLNLLRWASPRSIKETTVKCTDWTYPHMAEE